MLALVGVEYLKEGEDDLVSRLEGRVPVLTDPVIGPTRIILIRIIVSNGFEDWHT